MKKRLIALLLVAVMLIPSAIASAAYYFVNTNWVKVRALPESNAKVLDSYRRDWAMSVEQKYGGWAYVTFTNGKDGYVMSNYIKSSKSYRAYITTDSTMLRRGPDYSFSRVGTLAKGAKVTVLTHGSKYDYVSTTVGKGYVRNCFLSKNYVKPSGASSTALDTSGLSIASGTTGYVANENGRTVNLREGAGKQYRVIAEYAPGTQVSILSYGGTWCKIEVNGVTGYMMTKYLTTAAPIAGPTSPITSPGAGTKVYVANINGRTVNLRQGPGKQYKVIAEYAPGTEATLLSYGSTWCQIKVGSTSGYMMTQFLSYSKSTPTATATTGVDTSTYPPYAAIITSSNGGGVNVHRGAGLGYSNVTRLEVGTEVTVIEWTNSKWMKIRLSDGREGYVLKQYLKRK